MISIGYFHNVKIVIESKLFHWNDKGSSDKHFFRLETWKVLWTLLSSSGSSSLYATGPIRSRILKACKRGQILQLILFRSGFMGLFRVLENSTNGKCFTGSKNVFKCLDGPFTLPISFGMICRTLSNCVLKQLCQGLPVLDREMTVMI
ncbi:hypothetical protein Tco_1324050 [Tanacetum coccineum]